MKERDLDKQPYSDDEQRVARYISDICGIGGGDDPIGFLIASHKHLSAKLKSINSWIDKIHDTAYLY